MNATLTDRYLYAVTRSVPEKGRADVHAELSASITDAIDARVDGGEHRDAAERAVLTQLGDPDRLAADYSDSPTFLIGPRYFFEWRRLVVLLLWVIVPIGAVGIALAEVLQGGDIGEIIASAITGALSIALHVGFWVTLVFAILERNPGASQRQQKGSTKDGAWVTWSLDRLPDVRPKSLGRADLVASLVFLGLAAAAIVWDRFIGLAWFAGDAVETMDPAMWSPTSVLSPDLWPWWIAGLFAVMAGEAALAMIVFTRGRWTWADATVNAVLAIAVAVPTILLLVSGRLVNPEFTTALGIEGGVARTVFVVLAFVIAGIALWDLVDGFLKAARSGRTIAHSGRVAAVPS